MTQIQEKQFITALTKAKITPNKVFQLISLDNSIRTAVLKDIKSKKILNIIKPIMLILNITPVDIDSRSVGYYDNLKLIKLKYTFSKGILEMKIDGKTFKFDLRSPEDVLKEIITEKDIRKLKQSLSDFLKIVKE